MELDLRLGTSPAGQLSNDLAGEGGGRPTTSLKLGLCRVEVEEERMCSVDPQAQLNFLLPVQHLLALTNTSFEAPAREFEPSANSSPSSDQMRPSSRFSDDDEKDITRKKLRLSKEQSAFLEGNFKEHSTLKPKQKNALAKQLNLRPRQVEVWFQNRRARTKLKKTEVDCRNLKRCCQALTEENRRLQKELSDLKALKATHPFHTQFPATTLSMCEACGRESKSAVLNSGGVSKAVSVKPGPFTSLFANVRLHALTGLMLSPAHQPSAAS